MDTNKKAKQLLMVADSTNDNIPHGFQLVDISDVEVDELENHIDDLVETLFMEYEDAEWITYYIVTGDEVISYEAPTGVIQRNDWEDNVGFGDKGEQDKLTHQLIYG
jgi:hypothetical protein